MTARTATPLVAAAVALLAVLVSGSARLVSEGRAELAASDEAWKKGDAVGAAVHARGAARAYVPGAAHMHLGYERLRTIAAASEQKGDVESALFAWRAVLSADTSSLPFSAAAPEDRAIAEASLARLSAVIVGLARSPARSRPTPGSEVAAGTTAASRMGWGALLLGGAVLWCGAGVRLAARGWGSDGCLVRSELRTAGVMALAGLVAWVAGLLFG